MPVGLVSIFPLLFSNFLFRFICRSADMSRNTSIRIGRSIYTFFPPAIYHIAQIFVLVITPDPIYLFFKLLNEKNDDEDEEARAGLKKRNELLQQLLKDQDDERKVQEQHVSKSYFPFFTVPFSTRGIKPLLTRENNSMNVSLTTKRVISRRIR